MSFKLRKIKESENERENKLILAKTRSVIAKLHVVIRQPRRNIESSNQQQRIDNIFMRS